MSHARHDKAKPVLEASNLTVYLGGNIALENVSFCLHAGDSVAVAGPNGAGKSTLFKAVAGVIPYQTGRITVYGSEPGGHICIAYVPQSAAVDWTFPVSVHDAVMMGRTGRIGFFKRPGRADRSIESLLGGDRVGARGSLRGYPAPIQSESGDSRAGRRGAREEERERPLSGSSDKRSKIYVA